MPKFPTWVVKLGGSLVGGAALADWLATLSELSGRARIVIVAGGGPFADSVRDAQSGLGIDDATAHAMAILGMRQFALAIAALVPGTVPGLLTLDAIAERRDDTGLVVWDPSDPVLAASAIPADWTATSDSIAAWLGRHIGATGTVLVKSRHAASAGGLASALAAEAFIDTWLPQLLRGGEQPLWWLERSATREFAQLVAGAALPERAITGSMRQPG
jgi:aspartokinase-like uncharacterized kinase